MSTEYNTVPYHNHLGKYFQIEARDELGLGSDNLTYHLINSERKTLFICRNFINIIIVLLLAPGTFIVDRYTGIVRTMSKKYVAGQVYRVFVEVRDYRSPEQAKQAQINFNIKFYLKDKLG